MTTDEVAHHLVALCREGKFVDAVETLYSAGVVSIEAADYEGKGREMHGKEAVKGKNIEWLHNNEVHSVSVMGPFVSPERFAVSYAFDWTRKASGERVQLSEVAVYTVVDGKITREEFLYATGQ